MKMMIAPVGWAAILACAGCSATSTSTTGTDMSAPPATCNQAVLADFIGQTASAETGARIMAVSGARTLRWAGPGMAVTMDYRPERVTVSYDHAMVIERASCG